MRVTAHTSCRRYLPTIPMLAYHNTIDDWVARSSSAEACRSTPAHPCRALSLTPERCDAEVVLAVCIAIVVDGHGRVATAHQIAPWSPRWSRGSDLLSPTSVGAAFRSTSIGGFARSQSNMGIAQRSLIASGTRQKIGSATSYRSGHGHGPAELCLWTRAQNPRAARCRKSTILLVRTATYRAHQLQPAAPLSLARPSAPPSSGPAALDHPGRPSRQPTPLTQRTQAQPARRSTIGYDSAIDA